MWRLLRTMATSGWAGGARTLDDSGKCGQAHTAFVQSLVLLFMLVVFAVVVHVVFHAVFKRYPEMGVGWHHLLHDGVAAAIGAQSAVLVYRVVVLREQCR